MNQQNDKNEEIDFEKFDRAIKDLEIVFGCIKQFTHDGETLVEDLKDYFYGQDRVKNDGKEMFVGTMSALEKMVTDLHPTKTEDVLAKIISCDEDLKTDHLLSDK